MIRLGARESMDKKVDINFHTENLLIIHYPSLAGGRFVIMALALHPEFLFQHKAHAISKMAGEQDIDGSYKIAQTILNMRRLRGQHIEHDCHLLANFGCGDLIQDITADEKMCNQLWYELTNQEKFYFAMISHKDTLEFKRYINRKTITLTNFEWIIKERQDKNHESWLNEPYLKKFDSSVREWVDQSKKEKLPNRCFFDMTSLKDAQAFNNEIDMVLDFLGISQPAQNTLFQSRLEELRQTFLETYKIGFPWPN